MQGVDVFCERCGSLQPKPDTSTPRSAGVLARRVLDAVGITEAQRRPADDWLRLCLSCRGYSCPTCWNDADGLCQTCAPLPEPAVVEVLALEPAARPIVLDVPPPVLAPYVPEPIVYPVAPEPVFVAQTAPEPAYVIEMEPVFVAETEAEPEAEPEPVVLAEPEPEPEPVVVAQPEPPARPAPPRMPVLPLPPPRPANAPIIPLPTLPDYPVAPQIAFNEHMSVASSMVAAPVYEQHSLLAPPPEASHRGPGGLRPCTNCQLNLSARAHFCRRCGTAQPS